MDGERKRGVCEGEHSHGVTRLNLMASDDGRVFTHSNVYKSFFDYIRHYILLMRSENYIDRMEQEWRCEISHVMQRYSYQFFSNFHR
jgi:hypothetical protein